MCQSNLASWQLWCDTFLVANVASFVAKPKPFVRNAFCLNEPMEGSVGVSCGCPWCYHQALLQCVWEFGSAQHYYVGWGSPNQWDTLPSADHSVLPTPLSQADIRPAQQQMLPQLQWRHQKCWEHPETQQAGDRPASHGDDSLGDRTPDLQLSSQNICVISLLNHKGREFSNILSSK